MSESASSARRQEIFKYITYSMQRSEASLTAWDIGCIYVWTIIPANTESILPLKGEQIGIISNGYAKFIMNKTIVVRSLLKSSAKTTYR